MAGHLTVLKRALWTLFEDSGFSMAGAIAFSFLLSLFPFCIFLGALAGTIGGRDLAAFAVGQLFEAVPAPVANALAPEVERVMGQSQYGLLTIAFGNFLAGGIAFLIPRLKEMGLNLEGSGYFRFYTLLMLGAAVLFVIIASFYQGKTHLQSDEPAAEGVGL